MGPDQEKPELERLTCSIDLEELAEGDPRSGNRRFSMLGYSGAVVRRQYGLAVFDLEGIEMKAKFPILLEHDPSRIVGFGSGKVTPKGLECGGTIVTSQECGAQVADLSDAGFPWEASIGVLPTSWEEVQAGESAEVNGQVLEGPISIARKMRLAEVSFVTAGADKNTHAIALSALAQRKEREMSATTDRAELAAFLGKFPGNEGLAARRYAEGKSEAEVALELMQASRDELAQRDAELESLRAAKAELEAEREGIAKLRAQANEPGIGFQGGTSEELAADPADAFAAELGGGPLTADKAWESSAELRAAYGNSRKGFDAHVAREGLFASVEGF